MSSSNIKTVGDDNFLFTAGLRVVDATLVLMLYVRYSLDYKQFFVFFMLGHIYF